MRLTGTNSLEHGPIPQPVGPRHPVSVRWWVDESLNVREGWPDPAAQGDELALGWVVAGRPIGVIESPAEVGPDVLDALDERFPDHRWFAGDWDHTADRTRRAA